MQANEIRSKFIDTKIQSSKNELAALFSYAYLLDEGTIVHKDMGLSAHFYYQAQDLDSSTGHLLDSNAEAIRHALSLLGDGWMLETNLISESNDNFDDRGDYQDVVSQLIHQSRKLVFSESKPSFHSSCYFSLTYVPTGGFGKAISSSLVDEVSSDKKGPLTNLLKEKQYFEEVIERFCIQFEKITISGARRLKGDQLISFLHYCITGQYRFLKIPQVGYLLDSFLASQDFIAGTEPKIGDQYIQVLSIDDIPEQTWPAILDQLNYLGFEYRWSTRWIALGKESANNYLKKLQNRWSSKALGLLGAIKIALNIVPKLDEAAQSRKEQIEQAIYSQNMGEINHGFLTSVVVLTSKDLQILENQSREVTRLVEGLGFKIRKEILNVTEAYLGSIPGHGGYNIRKPIQDSLYASHTLPTSSLWQGSRYAPNPFLPKNSPPLMLVRSRDSRSFYFNLHVRDVGHFMVIGPTGMGKSTLVGLIGCRFMKYPKARIVLFDKDHSNRIWLKSLGGHYSDLNSDFQLSPFSNLEQLNTDTPEYDQEMDFLVNWLSELFTLQGVIMTPDRKNYVRESVINLMNTPKTHRKFSSLSFQDQELRIAFTSFTKSSVGKMLDGVENIGIDRVTGFETRELLKLGESFFIPILRVIFHQLTQAFTDRSPTLLILEEAWSFLRHSIFEKMLEDWLLTLRKFNVAVGFISQNVAHVTESKISGTIRESCPTKIFLPNPKIAEPSIAQKYLDFGLNAQQVEIIRTAEPKKEYYLNSDVGNRLFDTDLDPLTLSFIGVSKEEDIKKFNEIYQSNNPAWIKEWLTYRGLEKWGACL